ncbi:hypothetical protein KDL01_14395 [Actinospica durhamensis]|uniref:Uncharacterized protein n=1 Tax=Actinospica durhamensis TaxID=1508375 RepID=A0A941ITL0_9ACTN|nr:hypothetical protein [Actinospica durhamensis]MBR7834461.1 hypothetical protein [Actinospica durhamensis]
MAVIGTYCEICGLPVQLDHYVPMPGGGFWIWREDDTRSCDPVIEPGPELAWLSHAVALPWDSPEPWGGNVLPHPVVEGRVQDGCLESADGESVGVFPDIDDHGAAHHACWHLAGRPDSWRSLPDLTPPIALQKYQQQLFEFQALIDDGHAWMLTDPHADTPDGKRSRGRILDLLGSGPALS